MPLREVLLLLLLVKQLQHIASRLSTPVPRPEALAEISPMLLLMFNLPPALCLACGGGCALQVSKAVGACFSAAAKHAARLSYVDNMIFRWATRRYDLVMKRP